MPEIIDPEFAALQQEWAEIQASHSMKPGLEVSTRIGSDGRLIHIVQCANGYHESYESPTAALKLLLAAYHDPPYEHEVSEEKEPKE